jgi:hypothetical protein
MQLFERFQGEGLAMPYTMEDFDRQFAKEHFSKLTREEQGDVLRKMPVDELLTLLSAEQLQQLRDQITSGPPPKQRKPRRKK